MHYGACCRPGDTSKLAARKEWKEEDEKFLGIPKDKRSADMFTEREGRVA
jgi:hypothetical protein